MKKNVVSNKVVFYLLLSFLILRIGVVIIAGQKDFWGSDAVSYNGFAAAILQNSDWLINPNFIGDYRPPGYPMFIAIIYAIFGINNFLTVYIFQAIISTLMCLFIYKLSKKIFNDKVAVLSLIWSGFYIFYLQYIRMLLRETLIFFFIIVFFYSLYLYLTDETKKTRNFWLFSIIYFLLIHTDPRYLFYLPFLIILFIIYQPFWRGVKRYFTFLGITILLMIPWAIRNYIAYDGFVLINTRTLDLTESNVSMWLKPLRMEKIKSLDSSYPTEGEREIIKKGGNPNNRPAEEIEAIKSGAKAPISNIGRRLWNLREQWRVWKFAGSYKPSGKFIGVWSLKHNLSSGICYGILLPFMIFSIFYIFIKKDKIIWFLIFPPVIQTILHILMWGKDRYRNPIDSFIIMLGTYGIYLLFMALKGIYLKRMKY